MNKQFSIGISALWNTCSIFGRDLFEISDFRRCILLGISFGFTSLSIVMFLDQWMVNHGRRVDYQSFGELCMSIPTSATCFYFNDDRERPNCWLQLLGYITQIGSRHPGKPVCLMNEIDCTMLTWVYPDLIFLAVTAFSTGFGIFFNQLLPLVDVHSSLLVCTVGSN